MSNVAHETNASRLNVRSRNQAKSNTNAYFRHKVQTLLKGPSHIQVRRTEEDYNLLSDFQRIFHIQIGTRRTIHSWIFYEGGGERITDHVPGGVLYRAIWEKGDGSSYQLSGNIDKPTVKIVSLYVPTFHCEKIYSSLESLDLIITRGLVFRPKSQIENPTWDYTVLYRAFDFGYIELLWNQDTGDPELEASIQHVITALENVTTEANREHIYEMQMLFDIPSEAALKALENLSDNYR